MPVIGPNSRFLVVLALVALAVGGCFGGPTSDFPDRVTDDDGSPEPGAGTGGSSGGGGNGGAGAENPDNSGGSDAGDPPNGSGDAGTGGMGPDAGPAPDAGSICSWQSPAASGHCGGSHCDSTRAELRVSPSAACASTGSLDAICQAEPLPVVSACFQTHIAAPSRAAEVKACAAKDPKLQAVADDCIDCYVYLRECMAGACSTGCAEVGAACEACTETMCGAAFTICSGLSHP